MPKRENSCDPSRSAPNRGLRSSRRQWLRHAAALGAGGLFGATGEPARGWPQPVEPSGPALVALTLDLEMSRNFPRWEDTHWDYEKGNLDQPTKDYALAACRRVKSRGGVIHNFVVGRVLEQDNVDWLRAIAEEGHPIGNHTYDHVYVLAQSAEESQFRFRRAPWLVEGKSPAEIVRENIRLTNLAIQQRLKCPVRGFRTPGGFADGLLGRDDVQQTLLELGFRWVSSRYPSHASAGPGGPSVHAPSAAVVDSIEAAQAAAQPWVYPSGLVEVPMSPPSDIVAFRGGRWPLEDFLEVLRRMVSWTIERGAVFDFLAHPSCLGVVDPQLRAIDLICDLVEKAGDRAALVDLDALAQRAVALHG